MLQKHYIKWIVMNWTVENYLSSSLRIAVRHPTKCEVMVVVGVVVVVDVVVVEMIIVVEVVVLREVDLLLPITVVASLTEEVIVEAQVLAEVALLDGIPETIVKVEPLVGTGIAQKVHDEKRILLVIVKSRNDGKETESAVLLRADLALLDLIVRHRTQDP